MDPRGTPAQTPEEESEGGNGKGRERIVIPQAAGVYPQSHLHPDETMESVVFSDDPKETAMVLEHTDLPKGTLDDTSYRLQTAYKPARDVTELQEVSREQIKPIHMSKEAYHLSKETSQASEEASTKSEKGYQILEEPSKKTCMSTQLSEEKHRERKDSYQHDTEFLDLPKTPEYQTQQNISSYTVEATESSDKNICLSPREISLIDPEVRYQAEHCIHIPTVPQNSPVDPAYPTKNYRKISKEFSSSSEGVQNILQGGKKTQYSSNPGIVSGTQSILSSIETVVVPTPSESSPGSNSQSSVSCTKSGKIKQIKSPTSQLSQNVPQNPTDIPSSLMEDPPKLPPRRSQSISYYGGPRPSESIKRFRSQPRQRLRACPLCQKQTPSMSSSASYCQTKICSHFQLFSELDTPSQSPPKLPPRSSTCPPALPRRSPEYHLLLYRHSPKGKPQLARSSQASKSNSPDSSSATRLLSPEPSPKAKADSPGIRINLSPHSRVHRAEIYSSPERPPDVSPRSEGSILGLIEHSSESSPDRHSSSTESSKVIFLQPRENNLVCLPLSQQHNIQIPTSPTGQLEMHICFRERHAELQIRSSEHRYECEIRSSDCRPELQSKATERQPKFRSEQHEQQRRSSSQELPAVVTDTSPASPVVVSSDSTDPFASKVLLCYPDLHMRSQDEVHHKHKDVFYRSPEDSHGLKTKSFYRTQPLRRPLGSKTRSEDIIRQRRSLQSSQVYNPLSSSVNIPQHTNKRDYRDVTMRKEIAQSETSIISGGDLLVELSLKERKDTQKDFKDKPGGQQKSWAFKQSGERGAIPRVRLNEPEEKELENLSKESDLQPNIISVESDNIFSIFKRDVDVMILSCQNVFNFCQEMCCLSTEMYSIFHKLGTGETYISGDCKQVLNLILGLSNYSNKLIPLLTHTISFIKNCQDSIVGLDFIIGGLLTLVYKLVFSAKELANDYKALREKCYAVESETEGSDSRSKELFKQLDIILQTMSIIIAEVEEIHVELVTISRKFKEVLKETYTSPVKLQSKQSPQSTIVMSSPKHHSLTESKQAVSTKVEDPSPGVGLKAKDRTSPLKEIPISQSKETICEEDDYVLLRPTDSRTKDSQQLSSESHTRKSRRLSSQSVRYPFLLKPSTEGTESRTVHTTFPQHPTSSSSHEMSTAQKVTSSLASKISPEDKSRALLSFDFLQETTVSSSMHWLSPTSTQVRESTRPQFPELSPVSTSSPDECVRSVESAESPESERSSPVVSLETGSQISLIPSSKSSKSSRNRQGIQKAGKLMKSVKKLFKE